jgi:hypothetical protein
MVIQHERQFASSQSVLELDESKALLVDHMVQVEVEVAMGITIRNLIGIAPFVAKIIIL